MTNQSNAAQAANENPLSDEYVNEIIQRHGYDSPEAVIARLAQWIGLHGGENGVTLLMYEAHKALSKLRGTLGREAQPAAYLTLDEEGSPTMLFFDVVEAQLLRTRRRAGAAIPVPRSRCWQCANRCRARCAG